MRRRTPSRILRAGATSSRRVPLGRTDDAKAAARQVLALQPSFSAARLCGAIAIVPELAEPLTAAWHEAGRPG